MKRLPYLVLAAALAFAVVTPTSTAHNCNSGQAGGCGPCPEGEDHAHNDPENSCSSQASLLPGFTAPAALAGLAGALLAASRTRN